MARGRVAALAAVLGSPPASSQEGKVATGGRLDACKAVGCTTAFGPPSAARHARSARAKQRLWFGRGR
jgi:hypothetical protein